MIVVLERKNGVLPRLLTTPITRVEVIAGHLLAMFLVVFAQETLLVLMGQLVFGVDYLRQPGAILVMMVALALFAASLGMLISAISRKEDQVILLCLVAMFLFSALPSAWAMDGFQNVIVRGLGFSSVLLPAAILLVYTFVFFGLAIWRFKFE